MQKNRTLSCLSLTKMDGSLHLVPGCYKLPTAPGGSLRKDGPGWEKAEKTVNSPRPQAYLHVCVCVCVLCRLHICTCVFQCVVCAIKNLTKVLIIIIMRCQPKSTCNTKTKGPRAPTLSGPALLVAQHFLLTFIMTTAG